jgi:lipopolysaccharide/colanic/teichoic acid biosynthesis glycosyltransferase
MTSVQTKAIHTETSIWIKPAYRRAKRVLDVVLALLVLVPIGVLVMAILAILVKLDSRGPVFIRQTRIGQQGRAFGMLKFRSMYVNSDDALHRRAVERYMAGERISDGPAIQAPYKLLDDHRITRLGKRIRKTSLDELPQVLNVLLGQMSFVGPRPPLPYEVERYDARARLRLTGLPGITGPWQIYGRSRVPFEQMVDMDIAYLHRQSLAYDVKLILATVPAALSGSGAA